MLIRFRAANLYSFKEEIEFSMIPSPERIHSHQIFPKKKKNDIRLNRFAAVYGANAAGKSNLVKVLKFVQKMVVEGVKPEAVIPIQRFRLTQDYLHSPAKFEIEFKVGEHMYEYGFELDSRSIHREWLINFTRNSEKILFKRTTDQNGKAKLEFGSFINKFSKKEKLFLEFAGEGTRPNQLFLNESIDSNMMYFRGAYDWFRKVITVIEPMELYIPVELQMDEDKRFQDFLSQILRDSDTGIASIKADKMELDDLEDISEDAAQFINDHLSDADGFFLKVQQFRLTAIKEDDKIHLFKLIPTHRTLNGSEEAIFEVYEESDGTQRLIDLAPVLYELLLGENERVFVVDEFDRSLHPQLSRMIVELHLDENKSTQPSQLIVTTHQTNILDLNLLRKDEIWFVEKNPETGATDLYSLYDFQPRYDKDIKKDYLYGRYGAIPFLGNMSALKLSSKKK
ncbi:AAA family ATPase [Dactylococcopsis salina]|uniref:ATPase AAA-type core domain-containing protein n=1 Tax=Dactylococcopsis salina (strain PCC 8305) TaxID=13035 RepID=K9YZ51_DACS8|nr:ATP-binding protein [Dactylococcopsis salina]AFZ51762.1 hypothetical protein Dacsa_3243 [Dactylococcopsis salina PCC 8305]